MHPPSHIPDELDIATWLEPRAALSIVQEKIPALEGSLEWIVERLRANRIMALAENAHVNGRDFTRVFMRPEYWQHWAYLGPGIMNFWYGGDVTLYSSGGSMLIGRFFGVRFDPQGFGQKPLIQMPIGTPPATRASPYKAGRPPSNDEIIAKADEMRKRGMTGRNIAKNMRLESGFENVANVTVRELIDGRYSRTGRSGIKNSA